ncbi:MAG: V-type ATP synthase subunit D [Anaerolineae bacterium]|jgi:V/A-type H+-transporting ATPase subunit D|nr:V-type ATP synthase subunit D [Anaerolineae bacterium]
MARLNIPPTRSNYLKIKSDLAFAREGFNILDQKREVLTNELINLAHDAGILQEKVRAIFAESYQALEDARLTMGEERVEWAAFAVKQTISIAIKYRGVMGVPIPVVSAEGELAAMPYSFGDTMATLDAASNAFRDLLEWVTKLAEIESSVWRLARELRKTQRRVNALQYIFIPNYEDTLDFIQSAIEEREREEIFRLKLLKNKKQKEGKHPAQHEYHQPYAEKGGRPLPGGGGFGASSTGD